MKKIVVLASGSGSNFQAIINAAESGKIPAEVTGLITNKPGIGAISRAEKHHIPFSVIPGDSTPLFEKKLLAQLHEWKPDLIVLAGFLRKIPNSVIHHFQKKIINIHPSLLPKFGGKGYYGLRVHQGVIEAGDRQTGCTVHYVNEEYDSGAILDQAIISVSPDDTAETLAARVLEAEHKLLPEVINKLLNPNH